MSRPWTAAFIQSPPITGPDPIRQLDADIAGVLADRPDIQMVVYPEIHLCGDSDSAPDAAAWLDAAAEPLDGPRVQGLAAVAARRAVWLIPGSVPELGDEGRVYNTALVFDPAGTLIASYRKIFPWRPYETWSCGSEFIVFDVPGTGRFGLSIYYDSWFPESTRQLGWLGAEVVLNLVKTIGPDRKQELVLAQANAIVNQVYFFSLNAAEPPGWGQSVYVDPDGEVLALVADAERTVTVLDLDLDRVTQIRTEGTAGLNRLWEQLTPADEPIRLPAYDGSMTPGRWNPAHRGTGQLKGGDPLEPPSARQQDRGDPLEPPGARQGQHGQTEPEGAR